MNLHFERSGKGAPLLLIPGALGTGRGDFEHQIGWFAARRFDVIAPDPHGYGQSRPPRREYPLDFYHRDAADMFALMSALGHDRFSIIGWSDGGIAALYRATSQGARPAVRARKLREVSELPAVPVGTTSVPVGPTASRSAATTSSAPPRTAPMRRSEACTRSS